VNNAGPHSGGGGLERKRLVSPKAGSYRAAATRENAVEAPPLTPACDLDPGGGVGRPEPIRALRAISRLTRTV
jgi:hypothetical protein